MECLNCKKNLDYHKLAMRYNSWRDNCSYYICRNCADTIQENSLEKLTEGERYAVKRMGLFLQEATKIIKED